MGTLLRGAIIHRTRGVQEMAVPSRDGGIVRFGPFDADVGARELRRQGHKIRLQEQPFRVLAPLLQRPGEVITRQELHLALWPADTYGDFNPGLTTAITKMRPSPDEATATP